MAVRWKRSLCVLATVGLCTLACALRADEIRLKDGKKLYGVIVGYEDNMFKVKTDYGYVLVEKDKIASIIPTTPTKPKNEAAADAKPVKKEAVPDAAKPAPEAVKAANKEEALPKAEPAVAPVKESKPTETKREKAAEKPAKKVPEPAKNAAGNPPTPGQSGQPGGPVPAEAKPAEQPTPVVPKEPEPPAIKEEVQGNTYINHTYGFQMYKAPSWDLLDDARRSLPNAIVAMGTSSQSTVMVVGLEKTKDSLEPAAAAVEKRLHEAYENYRRLSEKKITVSGLPAVIYHYRGKEAEHDWSGTLVVVARGKDIFTVLGVTYADDDLIQIQENVIARSVASLGFSSQ